MSRQINFFADADDAASLHTSIRKLFPNLMVIHGDRGSPQELRAISVDSDQISGTRMFFVPDWALHQLIYDTVDDNLLWLNFIESPVLEYIPCIVRNNIICCGRIYWGYSGSLPAERQKQVDACFRWIRNHTTQIPSHKPFRIFKKAAMNRRLLDFGWGKIEPGPDWPIS